MESFCQKRNATIQKMNTKDWYQDQNYRLSAKTNQIHFYKKVLIDNCVVYMLDFGENIWL